MMLGSSNANPVTFLGMYSAYFTAPLKQQEDEEFKGTMYIGTNKRVLFTRRHQADTVQVYMSRFRSDAECAKKRQRGGEKTVRREVPRRRMKI